MAEENKPNTIIELNGLIPNLYLTQHPNNLKNYSIADAVNFRLSDDSSTLHTEESLIESEIIMNFLRNSNFYPNGYNILSYKVFQDICLFLIKNNYTNLVDIVIYNFENSTIAKVYNNIIYHNGEYIYDGFYNIYNEFILFLSEYNADEDVPLLYLNLGNFDNFKNNIDSNGNYTIYSSTNDRNINYEQLFLCPKLKYPIIKNVRYYLGNGILGIHYLYIRYKIGNRYTYWHSFGYPITLTEDISNSLFTEDMLEPGAIASKVYNIYDNNITYLNRTYITTFSIDTSYDSFQIGVVIQSKTYTKYYKTKDILINKNNEYSQFLFNTTDLIEENFDIIDYYNYYNVKCLYYFKNRLYIADYTTFNVKNFNNNNVNLSLNFIDKSNDILPDYYNSPTPLAYNINGTIVEAISNGILNIAINFAILVNNGRESSILQKVLDILTRQDYLYICFAKRKNNLFQGKIIKATRDSIQIKFYPNGALKEIKYFAETELFQSASIDNVYNPSNRNYQNIERTIKLDIDEAPISNTERYGLIISGSKPSYNTNKIFFYDNYLSTSDIILTYSLSGLASTQGNTFWNNGKALYRNIEGDTLCYVSNMDYGALLINSRNSSVPEDIDTEYTKYNMHYDDITSDFTSTFASDYLIPIYEDKTKYDYASNLNVLNETLIPEEIYKFYIHFINKYGEVSNGFLLKNNSYNIYIKNLNTFEYDSEIYIATLLNNQNEIEILFLPSKHTLNEIYENDDLFIYVFTLDDILDYEESYNYVKINNYNINKKYTENDKKLFLDNYELFTTNRYIFGNLYSDYFSNITFNNSFAPFYKNNENIYFKAIFNTFNSISNVTYDEDKILDFNKGNLRLGINVMLNSLPKDCIGYFITYDKIEDNTLLYGVSENIDVCLYNDLLNLKGINKNGVLYSKINTLNIDENIYINYAKNYLFDSNTSNFTNFIVKFAGEPKYGRSGKSTIFANNIRNTPNITNFDNFEWYRLFRGINYYYEKEPQLTRLGNYIYPNNYNNILNIIDNGLIGHLQRTYATVFNEKGVIYSYTIDETKPASEFSVIPKTLDLVQYDETVAKIFKLHVYVNGYINLSVKGQPTIMKNNLYVSPENLIDMFDILLPSIYENNLAIYNEYKITDVYDFYTNLIYSNVIQDENKIISLKFGIENYKFITEGNKKIYNIFSLLDTLYIHTDKEIYYLDFDNRVQASDNNFQIKEINIGDINYNKIIHTFSINIGAPNNKLLTRHYYIFYYNNNIFLLQNKKLYIIFKNFYDYFISHSIKYINFVEDYKRNRILLNIQFNDNSHISYNGNVQLNYIFSRLLYNFNYGDASQYNTLLLNNNTIFEFKDNNYDKTNYNNPTNINNNNIRSFISFFIKDDYSKIKYLEEIIFNCYNRNNELNTINNNFDLLGYHNLYKTADYYRIYNDILDTGWIEIDNNGLCYGNKSNLELKNNYKNVYYHLGNYHINYLRNKKINQELIVDGADDRSRLYGKYFIVQFAFLNNNNKIEFEYLKLNLNEDIVTRTN